MKKPIEILSGFIIFVYILIPTFTPNLMAVDTNAPKFFAMAILNLLVFLILVFNGYFKNNPEFISGFFSINIGLIYLGFVLVSLISFTQSINLSESVLQFTKIFTVFAAVFNLSVILMRDNSPVNLIIVIMAALLIFDAILIFINIYKFINGEIANILDIKTVYSNKNILASSIFIKLAFALFLMIFEKGWYQISGWIAFVFGVAAIFFMASRTFYLGLLILFLIFITYMLIVYFQKKQKHALWLGCITK